MNRGMLSALMGCLMLACATQAAEVDVAVGLTSAVDSFSSKLTTALNASSAMAVKVNSALGADFTLSRSGDSESFVQMKLGAVYEVDADGVKIQSNTLGEVSAEALAGSSDVTTLGSASGVARLALTTDLSKLFVESSLCAGAAAVGFAEDASSNATEANATLSFTAFANIGQDTTVSYGANSSVYVPAGAFKFNLESAAWPFCNESNSLVIEIKVKASNQAKPQMTNSTTGPSAISANTSVSANASVTVDGNSISASGSTSISIGAETKSALSRDGSNSSSTETTSSTSTSSNTSATAPTTYILFAIDANTTAQLALPTVAYASANSSIKYEVDVQVEEGVDGESTILLKFPVHRSIYYDPVTTFESSSSVEATSGDDGSSLTGSTTTSSTISSGSSNSSSTSQNAGGMVTVASAASQLLLAGAAAMLLAHM